MKQNIEQLPTEKEQAFAKLESKKKELIDKYNECRKQDKFLFFRSFSQESIRTIIYATQEYLMAKYDYYSKHESENDNIDIEIIEKQKNGIIGVYLRLLVAKTNPSNDPKDDPKTYYYDRLEPNLYQSHFKSSQQDCDFIRFIKDIFRKIFGCPTAHQVVDDIIPDLKGRQ